MSQETSNTIYVGNLNYSTTEEGLKQFFQRFGEVSNARVITAFFRRERVSRGFGFVDFANQQSCQNAINNKEPLQLDNRTIRIDPARPKVYHPKDTVFLGNLPAGTTADDIKAAFQGFNIVDVRLPPPRNLPFAFVKFETEEIQKAASEKKNVNIKGSEIPIKLARPPQRNQRGGFRRRGGRNNYRRRRAPRNNNNSNNNAQPSGN
ncbi:CUGBP Elav-like member 3 [Tritrichomonas musculus]|uniref:CUGBP Elav-like member 3 n=1 Tax=Tritrichomonas musculus TaxID=1915356 RepID=A0ABR2JUN0_9EUKA